MLLVLPFALLLVIFLFFFFQVYFLDIILCLLRCDQPAYFLPVSDDRVYSQVSGGSETISRLDCGLRIVVELMGSQQT